jgi:DNA adenine methylase
MTYYGAKTTIASQIASLLPAHRHYVEPFAGSLAVLLAKPASRIETVNDLDHDLMTFWRVMRDRPHDLAHVCALTPHSRAEYAHCRRTAPAVGELEAARRVWVLLTQGRARSLRASKAGWRFYTSAAGTYTGMVGQLDGYLTRIAPAAARLRQVSLECRPALDIIAAYGQHADTLLYVDPPYLRSTRTSLGYQHEMPTDTEHRQLADALHAAHAAVVLSGYPSTLYDHLYADWHHTIIPTGTGNGGTWTARSEALWSNRPLTRQTGLFDDIGGDAA